MSKRINQDTIVALTTPQGSGALGVIRISGPLSFGIVNALFPSKDLSLLSTHTIHFGNIVDIYNNSNVNEIVDEVVISLFKGRKSFTGEDTVEISAHGSSYILNRIIELCIIGGARLALPGEFTQRAFLNGKMDLAQAEAVADLIASNNKATHDIALHQMRGGISDELQLLREQLINFTALIELELDFSDEDVEFADRSQLNQLLTQLTNKLKQLIETFEYGNAIKNGVNVAIIGKPNAGKSTLLNALLREERAIVSDIAGTTRDVIEEVLTLKGIDFRFIDTAGIRETADQIEAIGVERAKTKVEQAKVVIHLYEHDTEILDELAPILTDKIVFNLRTKSILQPATISKDTLKSTYPNYIHHDISIKEMVGLDWLEDTLVSQFANRDWSESVIVTNVRHKEALSHSLQAIMQVREGMQMQLTGDLLAIYLKDALYHLGSITGKIDVDQDILGTIFGKFCIGK